MAVGCLKFIAHLCNQQVAHEALALEIMVLLLDNPTNDSVEIALEFASDVAALLEDTSPQSFTMYVLCACKLSAEQSYILHLRRWSALPCWMQPSS